MRYTLKITSWVNRNGRYTGYSGATHYYGRIQPGDIDLTHEVGLDDPDYDDNSLKRFRAKPGETEITVRFAKKEQVVEAAAKWMAEHAKREDTMEVLYLGTKYFSLKTFAKDLKKAMED